MQAKEFWETRYIRIPYGRVTARVVCLMEGLQLALHKQPGQARPSRDAGRSNPMGSVGFCPHLLFGRYTLFQSDAWQITLSKSPRLGLIYMLEKLGHSMDNINKLKWIISTHGTGKSKSWGLFWSCQLNSTANSAHLAHFYGELAELAVLFSW